MLITLSNLSRLNYLQQTLASVDQASNKHLVLDSSEVIEIPGWIVHSAPKPKTAYKADNKWATWSAFALAVEAQEDLIFLEDDVISCKNAISYLEGLRVPDDCALIQCYTPWGFGMPHGIWRYPAKLFSFCQALKIPLRTLELLVSCKQEIEAWCTLAGSDNCMAKVLGERKLFIGVHYPNIFQHIGDMSTINPQTIIRASPSFVGEDFDALKLSKWWSNHYM